MTVSEKSRWLILIVLFSALFLIVVDTTMLYTALPSLARDLGTSASDKLWIINAYTLVDKRMFIAGLGVFGIASLAAAYSPSSMILRETTKRPMHWRRIDHALTGAPRAGRLRRVPSSVQCRCGRTSATTVAAERRFRWTIRTSARDSLRPSSTRTFSRAAG